MYPTLFSTPGVKTFAENVDQERQAQLAKWGEQNHPDGTGLPGDWGQADVARRLCKDAANGGTLTWRHILQEEFCEALAESDPDRLRAELIQIASVCAAWVTAIDLRPGIPESYPCQIGVYCDECGVQVLRDHPVNDSMTKEDRLSAARVHLVRHEGWTCDDTQDQCPACTAKGSGK